VPTGVTSFARGYPVGVAAEDLDDERLPIFEDEQHDGERGQGMSGGKTKTSRKVLLPDPALPGAAYVFLETFGGERRILILVWSTHRL
jgi:hypothetical protein